MNRFKSWNRIKIGDRIHITAHPDLTITTLKKGAAEVALLGFMFDSGDYTTNHDDILRNICHDTNSFNDITKATYRYEHYGFDRQDATYFTPSSFHCHILGLQWKHFLNEKELFWGANDTFYSLGYETRFDYSSELEVGHKIKVGSGGSG